MKRAAWVGGDARRLSSAAQQAGLQSWLATTSSSQAAVPARHCSSSLACEPDRQGQVKRQEPC